MGYVMDPRAYWVGLNKIRGIGSVKNQKAA